MRKKWEFRHAQIELQTKLGEGAFGEVYSGFLGKENIRYPVAIKTVKCAHVTKGQIEETMAEARLMRTLSHRNIVHFYGVAAEKEPLMILMELVKGGSLDSYLEDNNVNISIEARLGMCVDVAHGLEYLHKKNILHRDIAARNCLYASDQLKISDFGMCRRGNEYQMKPEDRAPVRWMAPEVFLTKINSAASDVWAMGILFCEVFHNGQEPYEGWAGAQVRYEVLKKNFRLSLPDWAPEGLKQLLTKIWIADPMERITCGHVARALEKMCGSTVGKYSTSDENFSYLKKIREDDFMRFFAEGSVRRTNSSRVRKQKVKKKSRRSKLRSKKEHRKSISHEESSQKEGQVEIELGKKGKKKPKTRDQDKKSPTAEETGAEKRKANRVKRKKAH